MISKMIIEKLYLEENEFILVYDPDNLLGSEDIIDYINQFGFSIVNYDNPDVFRYYYEENIRSLLDQGKPLDKKILIRYMEQKSIPYDIRTRCFFVELTLREIFPKLSYNIIKELYNDVLDRLFKVYSSYNGPQLGDKGTKDYILKNVYGIIPEIIVDFQHLLKTFILLYYRGEELPGLIADYVNEAISYNDKLKRYPVKSIVGGKGSFFNFMQEQWEAYIKDIKTGDMTAIVDFSDYEIRAYIDNLFEENYLTPVKQLSIREYPSWMKSGILYDAAGSAVQKYENNITKIESAIKNAKSYKDWFSIAERWADVLVMKHDPEKNKSLDDLKFIETDRLIKRHFKEWLVENYDLLSSLSYAKSPVMVHKIPWYINHRFHKQVNKKIVMIVIDGMSIDNWFIIRNSLNEDKKYIFEETLCYAWIPTMTSVSRQAIFSGEIPANFSDSILSTNYDDKQWKKFWRNAGYNGDSIAYKRNIKDFRENGLLDIMDNSKLRVLGLVVNMVDDIMHGQQLSIEGMHQDLRLWVSKGSLGRFLDNLLIKGFEIFITSDHGNTVAIGQGIPREGLTVESPGERARFYDNEINCEDILSKYKAFEWEASGLPKKYNYILSEDNFAFVQDEKKIITHGGLSIEEVIVPFIHIRKEDHDA